MCWTISVLCLQAVLLTTLFVVCSHHPEDDQVKWITFGCFIGAESLLTFIVFANDKQRARNGEYRISEATLHLFTLFFGAIGAILGMCCCNHKTSKETFFVLQFFFQ